MVAVSARWAEGDLSFEISGADLFAPGSPPGPYVFRRGEQVLVGDVRLDNQAELRALLPGERFDQLDSDGALVLRAYEHWGSELFGHLAGDFSFVLIDMARRIVLAARDPFGIRRMHVLTIRDRLVFGTSATEIRNVLLREGCPLPIVDDNMIADWLLGLNLLRRRSFFSGIAQLEPGHFLVSESPVAKQQRYFFPPGQLLPLKSQAECEEVVADRLRAAVHGRLRDIKGAVTHLSGGLDSSSIAYFATEIARTGDTRVAFAMANNPVEGCNDLPYALKMADFLGVPLRCWNGQVPFLDDLTDPCVEWPASQGGAGGGVCGDLDLAERLGFSSVLSGECGNHITVESTGWVDLTEACGQRGGLSEYLRPPRRSDIIRPSARRIRQLLVQSGAAIRRHLRPPREERLPVLAAYLSPALVQDRGILERIVLEGAAHPLPPSWLPRFAAQRKVWSEMTRPLQSRIVAGHDFQARNRGVQMRYPFLDLRLVRTIMCIPPWLRPPRTWTRDLHRRAMRGRLPAEIRLRRRQAGFGRAFTRNIRAGLPAMRDIFSGERWLAAPYVARKHLKDLVEDLARLGGELSDNLEAWRFARRCCALEAWLRQLSA